MAGAGCGQAGGGRAAEEPHQDGLGGVVEVVPEQQDNWPGEWGEGAAEEVMAEVAEVGLGGIGGDGKSFGDEGPAELLGEVFNEGLVCVRFGAAQLVVGVKQTRLKVEG